MDELQAAEAAADRCAINGALATFSDRFLLSLEPSVGAAIRYALLGGGKRLRGTLLLAAYRASGGVGDGSGLAAAIEVVHAYSLVHDDLPCMDDDDMRRGRPTVHRVFGVPAATAAGVAMVPLAARCVVAAGIALDLPRSETSRLVTTLMSASGAGGMIAGQLLDLEGEAQTLRLEQLEQVHRAKTGALITAAVVLGGLAARGADDRIVALRRFGAAIGLAFQIADDVLDVTETTEVLGKTAGRDLALQKSTYPALMGIDGANARSERLVEEGCDALRQAGFLTASLKHLARFVIERKS